MPAAKDFKENFREAIRSSHSPSEGKWSYLDSDRVVGIATQTGDKSTYLLRRKNYKMMKSHFPDNVLENKKIFKRGINSYSRL